MRIQEFQRYILAWYKRHGRHSLPWRKTRNPYHILVSEVMLQQTQMTRVIPKYRTFMKAFPTMRSLARAKTPSLLRAWSGLGYNRRALYLRDTARAIIKNHNGVFPRDTRILESLPGIGPYTARAVAVFTWNTPEVFIETNIRRTYIYHFFKNQRTVHDRDILPLITKTLYYKNPRLWYSALMDYGSMLAINLPSASNPNRKSKHYTKQSRFEGSSRHARSLILNAILEHSRATYPSLNILLAKNPLFKKHSLPRLLQGLSRDGFIKKRDGRWEIVR